SRKDAPQLCGFCQKRCEFDQSSVAERVARWSYRSSSRCEGNLLILQIGLDGVVDLAGDVAFEAAHDLSFRECFGSAACDVGSGVGVPTHADHGDHVEGAVGRAVSSGVEAM